MPMVCMLSVVLNSGLQTQKLSPGAGTGEDLLASRLAVEVFARVLREGGSGKNKAVAAVKVHIFIGAMRPRK